jgi:hypothetical protein
MSCWVVPTVAAEIWGVSVGEVLRRIEAGEITVREENGWTFVDVAPGSPTIGPPMNRRPKPATFTMISSEEMDALCEDEIAEAEVSAFKDWRQARQRTSRLRLAPPKFVASV